MPISDLTPGEPQDLWLDLGKPETRAVHNPLDVGVQVCPVLPWGLPEFMACPTTSLGQGCAWSSVGLKAGMHATGAMQCTPEAVTANSHWVSASTTSNHAPCMQGLRTAQHTLASVLRHMPLLGTATGEPCKVHVEATYYRVGKEEVQAARRGQSIDQARPCYLVSRK